jgi:hypothetical protein
MKKLILSAAAVILAGAMPCAVHAASAVSSTYSRAELQSMIREARTQQQFQILSGYFRARQQYFQQQAAAEKVEWDRRSQNIVGPLAKYPRPVDSSRNRYEYFSYEAGQMGSQADHYEGLASARQ